MKKFGRLGVLMGGISNERDVSLKSGKAVACALKKAGIEVVAIDVTDINSVINEIKNARVDIVFIALHGKFGEDGTIQGMLEENGIPYTGSGVSASRLAMDKVRSRELFQKEGLSVPRCVVLNSHSHKEQTKSLRASRVYEGTAWQSHSCGIGFPCVVKPSCQGSSIGLSLVETEDKLKKATDLAYKHDNVVIVEEYIHGKEVTVGILDDKPLPVIHIVHGSRFYDYNAKYESNSTRYIVPADLSKRDYKRVQDSALLAHRLLGCKGFSRVDIILREDGVPVVLEVNTIPGLTLRSLLPKAAAAAGISFIELCMKIVENV